MCIRDRFTPQREASGTCPRCGAAVCEGKKNFYCSDRACSFVMWKNDLSLIHISFIDRFPQATELYRVMTTKPGEVSA